MRTRVLAFILLLTTGGSAWASFDMMIIPDQDAGGYVRYDPINRVKLGIMYSGSASWVAANSSRTFGYYSYGGGFMGRDNSTGQQLFNSPQSQRRVLSVDGALSAQFSTGGATLYNVTGTSSGSSVASFSAPGGFTAGGVISMAANRWVIYGTSATGLDLYLFDDTGTQLASATGAVASINVSASGMGQGARVVTQGSTSDNIAIPYRDSTGAHRVLLRSVLSNSFGSSNTHAVTGFSTASAATHLAAVESHVGFFLVGAEATLTNTARMTQFDDQLFTAVVQNYTVSGISPLTGQNWRMANLVAPEPGTMVALGSGVLLLLRRRKPPGRH